MKTKTFLLALFIIVPFCMYAQNDYASYLDKAMSKYEEGDCVAARKFYNVYKELSGKTVSSMEELLNGCKSKSGYAINDKIKVGDYYYSVAYTENNGEHGLAVYDWGEGPITSKMIRKRQLPSEQELNLISSNAYKINLPCDHYWTRDKASLNSDYYYRVILMCGTSCEYSSDRGKRNNYRILLIHRF